MTDAPAHAMSAASLPSPAPTAPTEQRAASAANAANAPDAISVVKAEDGIMQSTPIGPNCSLQSLRDGTYRMVSQSSSQLIDRTTYDSLFQQYLSRRTRSIDSSILQEFHTRLQHHVQPKHTSLAASQALTSFSQQTIASELYKRSVILHGLPYVLVVLVAWIVMQLQYIDSPYILGKPNT